MQKAVRDALIAFMAAMAEAQAEATREAQRAGIAHARANEPLTYRGRSRPSIARALISFSRCSISRPAPPRSRRRPGCRVKRSIGSRTIPRRRKGCSSSGAGKIGPHAYLEGWLRLPATSAVLAEPKARFSRLECSPRVTRSAHVALTNWLRVTRSGGLLSSRSPHPPMNWAGSRTKSSAPEHEGRRRLINATAPFRGLSFAAYQGHTARVLVFEVVRWTFMASNDTDVYDLSRGHRLRSVGPRPRCPRVGRSETFLNDQLNDRFAPIPVIPRRLGERVKSTRGDFQD